MNDHPLYMQPWYPNFDPLNLNPHDRPTWIRMYNIPTEYWSEEFLKKIGRSLGTLIEIDIELVDNNSYIYARIHIAVFRTIPEKIWFCAQGRHWL